MRPADTVDPATIQPFRNESEWEAHVKHIAEGFGWRYYHTRRSDNSVAGFPDCVMVRSPRVVFVELKMDRRQSVLTLTQASWIEDLETCPGVETYVWRPSDEAQVLTVLGGTEGPDG